MATSERVAKILDNVVLRFRPGVPWNEREGSSAVALVGLVDGRFEIAISRALRDDACVGYRDGDLPGFSVFSRFRIGCDIGRDGGRQGWIVRVGLNAYGTEALALPTAPEAQPYIHWFDPD